MALKQLIISKKIEAARAQLAELVKLDADFDTRKAALDTREAELEAAVNELPADASDEDRVVVDESVAEFEADRVTLDGEVDAHGNAKKGLEDEILRLNQELEKINNKPPVTDASEAPASSDTKRKDEIPVMRARNKIFEAMNYEQRTAFIARQEVKDFLERVRSFKGETRAVSGAELTIPDVMLELLRDNLYRYSKMIAVVRLRPIKGNARQNLTGAIPEGVWTEACATLNELSFRFYQQEYDGYKVGGFIPICNAVLEDSDLNLASEIMDNIGQAIGLGIDKAVLYGTGVKMPLGIATRLAQTAQPSDWGANDFPWADLSTKHIIKLNPGTLSPEKYFAQIFLTMGIAEPNYASGSTFWVMNRQTRMSLMAQTITFNAAGAIVAGQLGTMPVEGGAVIELPFVPDNDIIGGYGSLYNLIERHGMQLAQSEHVRFIEDQTVFKGTARYDGAPVRGEAFVLFNIADGDPTTTVPFAPDEANVVTGP